MLQRAPTNDLYCPRPSTEPKNFLDLEEYAREVYGVNDQTVIEACNCEDFAPTKHHGEMVPVASLFEDFYSGIPAHCINVPFTLARQLRPFSHDYDMSPGELTLPGTLLWMKLSEMQQKGNGLELFSFTRFSIQIGHSALLGKNVLQECMQKILRESACPDFTLTSTRKVGFQV